MRLGLKLRGGSDDLTCDSFENLRDVLVGPDRGLQERAVEGGREGFALLVRDDSISLQIAPISDQDHGNALNTLDTQDLIPNVFHIVEARLNGDVVGQNESSAVLDVQVAHGRELFLDCRVKKQ